MPFRLDAAVLVKSLGKTGRVVEAGRGGRYRVRVGGVVMACREEDLDAAGAGDRKRAKKAGHEEEGREENAKTLFDAATALSQSERRRLGSLDLHGFTVEEALSKVEERLDLALRAGLESVEIIHGRGSGRIKVAVHRLLGELSAVRHFEVARDNPGVTRVFF
jgi:DNA mismatch repair protein MutS2